MKIKEYLKTHTDYNSFQVVIGGDRWTDVLSKEETLKTFGDAEVEHTELNGEDYICWMVLFIADMDFKE